MPGWTQQVWKMANDGLDANFKNQSVPLAEALENDPWFIGWPFSGKMKTARPIRLDGVFGYISPQTSDLVATVVLYDGVIFRAKKIEKFRFQNIIP